MKRVGIKRTGPFPLPSLLARCAIAVVVSLVMVFNSKGVNPDDWPFAIPWALFAGILWTGLAHMFDD